ncbi:PE-PPE domain-containing protein [Mycobacterium stomatepiae]|uniref:PE-PPE domain-containing protein n=1 Tax=Mycobacterium stomatepiae TaxID=470076 RepID=A0A7I7QF48_9MYCO|nr:PE-PPE domain-containing protein [Mycobacterium stomatepiae]MCV7167242.1 PE-PPE domain-containing protein [Mycobacterium stomatepiae]BBY24687.1 hypothetical protein MSTO_48920 [Mycobacterium stomatepiae]
MRTAQLPLLDPLRTCLPVLGNPLADVIQPFLGPIIDLGRAPGIWLPAPLSVAENAGQGAVTGVTTPSAAKPPLIPSGVASRF